MGVITAEPPTMPKYGSTHPGKYPPNVKMQLLTANCYVVIYTNWMCGRISHVIAAYKDVWVMMNGSNDNIDTSNEAVSDNVGWKGGVQADPRVMSQSPGRRDQADPKVMSQSVWVPSEGGPERSKNNDLISVSPQGGEPDRPKSNEPICVGPQGGGTKQT